MALFEQFPYTNFHEMNMDWLLHKVKAISKEVDSIISDEEKYFFVTFTYDSVSQTYSADKTYSQITEALATGKYLACIYQGKKYYDAFVTAGGNPPVISYEFHTSLITGIVNSTSASIRFTKFKIASDDTITVAIYNATL